MKKAGYNLQGMHDFFIRNNGTGINKLLKNGLQWISTHPADDERAALFKYSKKNYYKEVVSSIKWQEMQKLAKCSD
jgi:predicted Zn-dependent protease